MNLSGKVVLITGSSQGIGKETAFLFAKERAKLVITYHKNKSGAEEAAEKCREFGAEDVLVLPLDLRENESIKNAVAKTVERFGGIDVLINNAGYLAEKKTRDQTFEDIEDQVRTNLEGLIKMTSAALLHIKEAVINIASGAGKSPYAELATYSATKFGVRGFTQSLAIEEPKLRIIAVNPGLTATAMTDFEGEPPQHVAEVVLKATKGDI